MAKQVGGTDPRTAANKNGAEEPKKWGLQRLWVFFVGPVLIVAMGAGHFHLARREAAPSPVTELTDDTFVKFIAKSPDGVLVDFYSPDCGHCQKLVPEFEASALEHSDSVPFATVNAEESVGLAKLYGIQRYPTVLFIQNAESVQELPPRSRTADKIKEFLAWVRQPALIEFESRAELEEAVPTFRETLSDALPPVIAGFAGKPGVRDAFERAATHFRGKTVFLWITEAKDEGPILASYSQTVEEDRTYDGPVSKEAVYDWVKEFIDKKDKEKEAARAEKEAATEAAKEPKVEEA